MGGGGFSTCEKIGLRSKTRQATLTIHETPPNNLRTEGVFALGVKLMFGNDQYWFTYVYYWWWIRLSQGSSIEKWIDFLMMRESAVNKNHPYLS